MILITPSYPVASVASPSDNGPSLSMMALIGIILGAIVFLLLVILIIVATVGLSKKRKNDDERSYGREQYELM